MKVDSSHLSILRNRWLSFIFLSIISFIYLSGENIKISPTLEKFPIQFEHISDKNGLSQNTVHCILQGSNGFMWFGTERGLNRYDGYRFTVFPLDKTLSFPSSHLSITAIFEDNLKNIWIGTEKGLYRLNSKTENIEFLDLNIKSKDVKVINGFITCINQDSKNRIWIGTDAGLIQFISDQKIPRHFSHQADNIHSLSNNKIRDIQEDKNGKVWIATDEGLNFLDKNGIQIHRTFSNISDSEIVPTGKITCLFIDSGNSLWVGTDGNGLYFLSPGAQKFTHYIHDPDNHNSIGENIITCLGEDINERVWIGYYSAGIDIINKKKNLILHLSYNSNYSPSLSNNKITTLYKDRSNTIWIGTHGSGLNIWNPTMQKFRLYRYIPYSPDGLGIVNINSFCEDNQKKIWIAGDNGVDQFDPQTGKFLHISEKIWTPGVVNLLYKKPDSNESILWLGIKNGEHELIKLDLHRLQVFEKYDLNAGFDFKGDMVTTLLAENNNTLWIGTDHGLFKMNANSGEYISGISESPIINSLSEDYINVLYLTRANILWIGTRKNGLLFYDLANHHINRYLNKPDDLTSLSHNDVLSLVEDQSGDLWVGTSWGLNRFDRQNKNFIRFTTDSGLPGNVINGIIPDRENTLWISTNRGLSRFDGKKKIFRNYDTRDGLQNDQFNPSSCLKSKSDELFFGGIEGFNSFYPQEIQNNNNIPPVKITTFNTINSPEPIGSSMYRQTPTKNLILDQSEIYISTEDNTFAIGFSALNFIFPEKNEYAVMIEGIDEDWNYIGNKNFVIYSGFPPGEYVFKVKASNNDGIWNQEGTAITIHIKSPFWTTWWFRLLGLIVLSITILILYNLWPKRSKKIEKEEEKITPEVNQPPKEKKHVEEEILASEMKYKHLVETSNEAIYILYNRKFELINQRFKELFKVTQEYVTSPDFDFLELVSPKSKNSVEKRIQMIINGEQIESNFIFTAHSTTKEEFEVEASASKIRYRDGTALQGILRDITERKNMERMIQQAQKLEAVGTLAGGIAHDFNNILTGIQGRVSLIQMGIKSKDSSKDHLEEIELYVNNAADLTKQLLGFARKGRVEVKPIDINQLVKKSSEMFGRTKKEIGIKSIFQKDLWTVEVDPGQMDQVFMNLFVNASQAMPEGGDLFIESKNIELDKNQAKLHLVKPGKFIKISVTDTGMGMDEETRRRIFDPFFTTKERSRGTGLGLATVYGILQNHGGFITVYSELNIGTTFNIYLPASSKRPIVESMIKEELIYGTETILLVDDEAMVLEVVGQIIESLGYNILLASGGEEAIDIYWKNRNQIDLIILDLIMPHMSGSATYDRLRGINPNIKVLVSSGYSIDGQASELLKKGCGGFIQKPFSNKELSRKIREVLDKTETNQE